MKQIKNSLFYFAVVLLLPNFIFAQNYYPSINDKINGIDMQIRNLISQRKINHENQETINAFVVEGGKWFKAISDIQNKINYAKSRSGDYSTFNKKDLLKEIQNLEQQKKEINSLNGGVTINRRTYNSINELQDALTEQSLLMVELINDDEKLSNDLQELDIIRDKMVADFETDEKVNQKNILWNKLQHLKQKQQFLEEDYNKDSHDIVTPAIWCTKKGKNSSLKCLHRNLYISTLTEVYIKKLDETGKKYDQNELAGMIKNAQKQSENVKKEAKYMLRERYHELNALQQEIGAIEKKYWEEENNIDIDPSGCWAIAIGTGSRPQINIVKNAYGEFDGIIMDPGPLAYKKGKRLFTIARINSTTFKGTEYSHSESGITTRISLRVIVQKGRNSADYRTSDDHLTLLPCW